MSLSDWIKRPWVRRALVGAGVLAALLVAGVVLAARALDPERLADFVQPRLSTFLDREVEIGTADVGLFPPTFEMGQLSVADSTGLTPSLAAADAIRLRIRLLPLLRRAVVVDRVVVLGPTIDLRVDAAGRSNIPGSPEEVDGSTRGDPLSLDLRRIEIEDGRLSYRNERDSVVTLLEGFSTVSSVRREASGQWRFQGRAAGVVGYESPVGPPLEAVDVESEFELEAPGGFEQLVVRRGTLSVEGIDFSLAGTVSELEEPTRNVDLAATVQGLPLTRVVERMPDSVRARIGNAAGLIDADVVVRGPFGVGRRPTVHGWVRLSDGSLETMDGELLAERVSARVDITEEGPLIPHLEGRVLGGAATIDGEVILGETRRAYLDVEADTDLGLATSFATLPEGSSLVGRLTSRLRLDIPLEAPADVTGEGTLSLVDVTVRHPSLGVPVQVARGDARLEGRRVLFTDVPIGLGADRIVVGGELLDPTAFADPGRPAYVEADVRSARIDIEALGAEPPADTTLTYGRIAFARLGGRSVGGVTDREAARVLGLERPDSLPVAGRVTVAVDTLVDRRGQSRDFRAVVEFGPDFLRVPEASFARYGGRVVAGADLSLGPAEDQPFALSLRVEEVDAVSFLSDTSPLGRVARGTFSAAMDFTGALDEALLPTASSLVGGGRFTLADGSLRPTEVTARLSSFLNLAELAEPAIRSWTTPFTVEGGAVRLAESTIQGAPGSPRVGGTVALDGSIDLGAVFDLPRVRLDSATVRRLGGAAVVAERMIGNGELTRAELRIQGTVGAPEVGAVWGGATSTLETVRDAATDAARQEIEAQVQSRRDELEQRAGGAIRDLLQRRLPGATGARPPPSGPDTIRPDTIRPDTIPPDTIRPDTVRPDTARIMRSSDSLPVDTVGVDTTSADTLAVDSARADTVRTDTVRTDTIPMHARPGRSTGGR